MLVGLATLMGAQIANAGFIAAPVVPAVMTPVAEAVSSVSLGAIVFVFVVIMMLTAKPPAKKPIAKDTSAQSQQ